MDSQWASLALCQLYSITLCAIIAVYSLALCTRKRRRNVPANLPPSHTNKPQAIAPKELEAKTTVELMLSAKNLADKDILTKSDPMCVVYTLSQSPNGNVDFKEFGRTEQIDNCLNPQWNTKFELPYYFEQRQPLKFEIYDIDSKSPDLKKHDFLGSVETDLADILAAPGGLLTLNLTGVRRGQLMVRAEEVDQGQKEILYCVVRGENLDKKDCYGKSDPFLEFYRLLSDGQRQLVHRTEVIKYTLNPRWKPFEVNIRHLSRGNKDAEFQIECWDWDFDGGHKIIGSCRATVNGLANDHRKALPLIHDDLARKKGRSYRNSGTLHFLDFQVRHEYTFLDYIRGGLQLEFGVAVDYTASNGAVNSPSSLHFVGYGTPNQYEMAIQAVLEICEHYNKTRVYDAVGFGAQIPPGMFVSHLFPLNLETMQREVHDKQGVMEAYRECQKRAVLSGPTCFAPTINDFARRAAMMPPGERYQILLIITDGCINDMQQAKEAIIGAAVLPLSIIIVGVGNADFTAMDVLDGDSIRVNDGRGNFAARDIVQFVPFRKFLPTLGSVFQNPARVVQSALAKEVLYEVPGQITSYMKSKGTPARPPLVQPYPEQGMSRLPAPKSVRSQPSHLAPYPQRSSHGSLQRSGSSHATTSRSGSTTRSSQQQRTSKGSKHRGRKHHKRRGSKGSKQRVSKSSKRHTNSTQSSATKKSYRV